jgi:TonB family protein
MAYSLLTALLLGWAALAAEHSLRLHDRPTRWVWLGAIFASLALPTFYLAVPSASPDNLGPLSAGLTAVIEAAKVATPIASESPHLLARIDPLLTGVWLVASAALLLFYFRSFQRLRRASRGWSIRTVDGKRILVAADMGPAVMGFGRGQIVIPEWTLELEEDHRKIVILHEEEHVRAGDHRLLHAGQSALVFLPWNPILWWMVRRLRSAVEFDCDRRVLRRGAHLYTYSTLLIEVGRRTSRRSLPQAAFAESKSLLERRIRRMAAVAPRYRGRKSVLAASVAAFLLLFACQARPPTEPAMDNGLARMMSEPIETPFTVRPKVKDPLAAVLAVQRNYPEALREAGSAGRVGVWILIDVDGKVKNARLAESSENPILDRAALAAAGQFEYEPAQHEGASIPAWFRVSIEFTPPQDFEGP